MKPGEETLGEASQMLRDILQSKEKKSKQNEQQQQQTQQQQQQQQQLGDNNNTLKTFDTLSTRSPINNFCTASDSDSHEMMNSLLRGKSSSSKANSVEDNDAQSENFNNLSGDESDLDSSYGGQLACSDEAQKGNDTEQDDDNNTADNMSPTDSKEAKRARVENILTTIRQSPQAGFDTLTQSSYNEMKRQKRKQPQPQQHDVRSILAPEAKCRKVERMVLQEHIRQLQEQLHAVKRSFHQISSQCESDDDDRDLSMGREDLENDDTAVSPLHDMYVRVPHRDGKDPVMPYVNGLSPRNAASREDAGPLTSTPSAPLRVNGKSPGESTGHSFSLKVRDSLPTQNGGFASSALPPKSGLQHAALTLKSEIIEAVAEAVDSALSTVLEKHAGTLSEQQQQQPQHVKGESQQNQQQSSQQHQHQQQPQHSLPLPSQPLKQPEPFQLPLSMPRPKPEREALKETVSNSQTERGPELTIPYPDPLRLLEGIGNRSLQDKPLSAFEPLHRSESSELIKPHTSTALPFPPHYPYSYMHPGLLPPVFPVEPEQTEALPLVVSSVPKKKRTKVTDTRLSPRAKTALLQDSPVVSLPSMMAEVGERHPGLPSPFPHPYLPPVLPTSVAIPNPNLHRSDLFSFRFPDSMFDSRMPSPPLPQGDRSSPKSPMQDSMHGLLKSDVFDTSVSESMDGQNAQKISFCCCNRCCFLFILFFFFCLPPSSVCLSICLSSSSFCSSSFLLLLLLLLLRFQCVVSVSIRLSPFYLSASPFSDLSGRRSCKPASALTLSMCVRTQKIKNMR